MQASEEEEVVEVVVDLEAEDVVAQQPVTSARQVVAAEAEAEASVEDSVVRQGVRMEVTAASSFPS